MNIRNKLLSAFAAVLALSSSVGVIAFFAVRNLADDVRAQTYLSEVERGVWELRFGLPNYISGEVDGRVKIRADSEKWLKQVTGKLEAYRAMGDTPAELALVDEFMENFKQYTKARPVYLDLVDAGKLDQARTFRATETNPPAARMVKNLVELVDLQQKGAIAQAVRFQTLVLLSILLSILLGGGLILLISNSLARPVRQLAGQARQIASGDLREAVLVGIDKRSDEIGELNQSFAAMAGRLQGALASLHEVTRALNDAVVELSSSSEQQNQSISRQAAALQETQVTAEEIRQTSLAAAEKASSVLKMTERADEIGRSGETAVEQSMGGMTEIRSVAEQIAAKISELSERTRQLGGITDVVKDLADQSTMLALNAAIEAVRSGEHGKGFGVVAREIRSLADQSIQSTTRAREILEDVGDSIRVAVSITENGAVKMEGGLQQIKASGEHLRQLSGIIKENTGVVRQIAFTVSQQNAGLSQIFTAVTDLSNMMNETVKRLDSINKAVETVKDVSTKISTIVKE